MSRFAAMLQYFSATLCGIFRFSRPKLDDARLIKVRSLRSEHVSHQCELYINHYCNTYYLYNKSFNHCSYNESLQFLSIPAFWVSKTTDSPAILNIYLYTSQEKDKDRNSRRRRGLVV